MKKFKFTISGSKYEVSVNEIDKDIAEIEVNGTPFTVEIEREAKNLASAPIFKAGAKTASVASKPKTGAIIISSPLPGSIVKTLVSAGQNVKRGDLLLTIESMKMENNVLAETDGTIKAVLVQPGQSVMQGDKLVEMEGFATEEAPKAEPVAAPKPASAPAPKAAPKAASKATGGYVIKSPLPGSVVKISATVGQSVKRGDLILTLESMKMENNILSEKDGVVKEIFVQQGQSVMQDDLLASLE